jgi:glycosyltransferase involved in cell wall biosynthesis
MASKVNAMQAEMKRVLFVSYIFPPMLGGGVQRVAQTCKFLPEFGWAPTVLTVEVPALPRSNERLLAELSDEVQIVRAYCPLIGPGTQNQPHRQAGWAGLLRSMKRKIARLAFLPDWQITWYPGAMKAGRELLAREKFDAVLATYGPATNLLVGSRLAKFSGLPLVLDFRDLWADNPLPSFPTPLHQYACRRMERKFVAQADRVVAVSEAMIAKLASTYDLPGDKIACVTNGFDPNDAARVYDDRPSDRPARPFRLTFTGSVYGNIHFGTLFEVVADLAREGKISPQTFRLVFVGNMTLDEPRRLGVADFVELHPPVPHEQVFDFFARSDALLLNEMIGYHARYSFGSKLFDYLLAGKPILGLTEESDMTARVVREVGGRVVHPQDKTGLRAALLAYLAQGHPEFAPVDIQREPYRTFDRRRLTERLAEVLDRAIQNGDDRSDAKASAGLQISRSACKLETSP